MMIIIIVRIRISYIPFIYQYKIRRRESVEHWNEIYSISFERKTREFWVFCFCDFDGISVKAEKEETNEKLRYFIDHIYDCYQCQHPILSSQFHQWISVIFFFVELIAFGIVASIIVIICIDFWISMTAHRTERRKNNFYKFFENFHKTFIGNCGFYMERSFLWFPFQKKKSTFSSY